MPVLKLVVRWWPQRHQTRPTPQLNYLQGYVGQETKFYALPPCFSISASCQYDGMDGSVVPCEVAPVTVNQSDNDMNSSHLDVFMNISCSFMRQQYCYLNLNEPFRGRTIPNHNHTDE